MVKLVFLVSIFSVLMVFGDCQSVDCSILLISGDLNENETGIYNVQKERTDEMVGVTPDTRVYTDLGGNMHLYHRISVGWVIGSESSMNSADASEFFVKSGVTDTDIISGGRWNNGAVTTCLDDDECESYANNLHVEPNITKHFPFTERIHSTDGKFCSRLQYGEEVFEYMKTDPLGFPIYTSGNMLLTKTPSQPIRHQLYQQQENYSKKPYKAYMITNGKYSNNPLINFDTKSAICKRSARVSISAAAVWARWNLPEDSLTDATEWELGVSVKVLSSHISTYFMTVQFAPGGYSGIQEGLFNPEQAPSGKTALFSFWNSITGNVTPTFINSEAGVTYSEFGGEGTGGHTSKDYPWKIQEINSIKLRGSRPDKSSSHWDVECHMTDPNNPDEWVHQATLSRTSDEDPLEEWGLNVFIEDWGSHECDQGFRYKREAEYLNPYALVDGQKVDLTGEDFSEDQPDGTLAGPLAFRENIGGLNIRLSTGGIKTP